MVSAVRTEGLAKHYGPVRAVDGLDLDVPRGEVYGLLGLNGAGKTTTVKMLTTLLEPTSGRAWVDGMDVTEDPAAVRARIGVVTEKNLAGEPGWSPARYLTHFARLYHIPRREAHERIEGLLGVLKLTEYAERRLDKLSGGNLRKVELARALLHRPRILFLDEPTRELDIPAKKATWAFLRGVAADGVTVFLSSHDVEEIGMLCDRIGILQGGRLGWQGTRDALVGDSGASLIDALAEALERPPPMPAPEAGPGRDRVSFSPA